METSRYPEPSIQEMVAFLDDQFSQLPGSYVAEFVDANGRHIRRSYGYRHNLFENGPGYRVYLYKHKSWDLLLLRDGSWLVVRIRKPPQISQVTHCSTSELQSFFMEIGSYEKALDVVYAAFSSLLELSDHPKDWTQLKERIADKVAQICP